MKTFWKALGQVLIKVAPVLLETLAEVHAAKKAEKK